MNILNKKNLKYLKDNHMLIPRLLKNYGLITIGKKPLRTVELAVTYECQCKCEFCSITAYPNLKKNKRVVFSLYKKIIDDSIDLGAIHFLITGGEPLLYHDLFELIRYIKSKKSICTIVSNAGCLDRKKIEKLKKSGLDLLEISIDSIIPEKHDESRKLEGCFERVMNAIKYSKENMLDIMLNLVVQGSNIDELEEIVDLIQKENISLNLGFISNVGKWEGKNLLNERQFEKVNQVLKHDNVRWCGDGAFWKKGCSAGLEKMYISPYGDVSPCPLVAKIFGNVHEDNISNIRKKILKEGSFNRIHSRCLPSKANE